MKRVNGLKALIYGKFDSESQFATAIGWSKQRLNKITRGKKEPTVSDLNELANGLGEPVQNILNIFLAQ